MLTEMPPNMLDSYEGAMAISYPSSSSREAVDVGMMESSAAVVVLLSCMSAMMDAVVSCVERR